MNMGLGITKAGGCTYTALKMHNYSHKDPALSIPLNCIVDFVQAVGSNGMQWADDAFGGGVEGRV